MTPESTPGTRRPRRRVAMYLGALALLWYAPLAVAGQIATLHGRLAVGADGLPAAPGSQAQDGGPRRFVPLGELPGASPVPDIDRIGLERTECFGTCPAYTVIIAADGAFTYTGERHVERLGEHRGTVPRWYLNNVLRYVAAIDFMELADTYSSGSLDTPSSYTLVEWGGVTKVVLDHDNAAPATVWALARLIDDMLELATWE